MVTESAETVEDSGVPKVREQALTIRREGIGGDALFSAGNYKETKARKYQWYKINTQVDGDRD